jgi:hypothetical protein
LNNWIHNTIAIKHNFKSVHYSLKWLARKAVIPSCQVQLSCDNTWNRQLIAQKTTRISVKLMDAPRIASINELLSEWYAQWSSEDWLNIRYTVSDLDLNIMILSELCLKGISQWSYLCGIWLTFAQN